MSLFPGHSIYSIPLTGNPCRTNNLWSPRLLGSLVYSAVFACSWKRRTRGMQKATPGTSARRRSFITATAPCLENAACARVTFSRLEACQRTTTRVTGLQKERLEPSHLADFQASARLSGKPIFSGENRGSQLRFPK